ncbi:MAG: type II toxin-antitoxin system VapC family toxin, partial [Myxococcota bacterium]
MRICLDTSAYSAFKRGHEGALDVMQQADELVLPAVVVGELLAGFRIGTHEAINRRDLDRLLDSPRVSVAVLDADTGERYADIVAYLRAQGRPIPTNDIWIAATAMQWGL